MTGEAKRRRLKRTERDIIQARLSSIAAELRPLFNWHAGHRMESGK